MGTFSFRKAQKLTRELRLLFPTLPFLISPTDDAPKQPRRGELIIESAVVELRLGVGKLSVLKSCVYSFLRWTAKIRFKGRAQYQGPCEIRRQQYSYYWLRGLVNRNR